MINLQTVLVSAALLAPTVAVAGPPALMTTFDSGTAGWTAGAATTIEWQPVGGNPGGYLSIGDNGVPDMSIIAPAAYLGDRSAYIGGTFVFDGRVFDSFGNTICNPGYGRVTLTGGADGSITVQRDLSPGCASESCWTRFAAPFTAAAWGVNDATWLDLTSNLSSVVMNVEGLVQSEIQCVDNIGLLPPGTTYQDLTGDGQIDGADLGVLLAAWGPCGDCCNADLNGDGTVDGADLGMLLGLWSD